SPRVATPLRWADRQSGVPFRHDGGQGKRCPAYPTPRCRLHVPHQTVAVAPALVGRPALFPAAERATGALALTRIMAWSFQVLRPQNKKPPACAGGPGVAFCLAYLSS